jgi:hypothetical protein
VGIALVAAGVVVGSVVFAIVGAALALIGFLFGSLTVTIDDTLLRTQFGNGPIKKTIGMDDIVSAEIVRNKWWYGWGIRRAPRGWMWNIAGLDAVAIHRRNATTFVLGTDEPERLLNAIVSAANLRDRSART